MEGPFEAYPSINSGWLGYGDWRDAISAFIFTWPSGDTSVPALKMPKTGGSGMAIIDEPGAGPKFGPSGLEVNLDQRSAKARLGSYYERRPDGKRTLWSTETPTVALESVRVYVGLTETAKAANYAPSMLQWQPGELEKIRERDLDAK